MKFFQKQKVDQVGITSVALQKILVVLMLMSIFTLFNGGLISFILCLIGFIGAYKRHTGLLRAYVSISVALIIIAFVFAIISSFQSLNGTDYEEYSYDYSSSASVSSSEMNIGYSNSKFAAARQLYNKLRGPVTVPPPPTPSPLPNNYPMDPANPTTPTDSNYPTPSATSEGSYVEEDYTVFIFLAIAVMILAFFVVYLKIFSLVLAYRLRKMILTAATTLPTTDSQTHEFTPANTSCAVPEETPAPVTPQAPASPAMPFNFTPGFAPYPYPYPMMPMMPNNMAGQAPHHMMFGQQPVFYTYAPMPQTPATPSDEKL